MATTATGGLPLQRKATMTKRQLIDTIVSMNHTAEPGFLAQFADTQLDDYLRHLQTAQAPRLSGDPHRFDHYFDGRPSVALTASAVATMEPEDDTIPLAPIEPIQEEDQGDLPAILDLNISADALFNESYETPPAGDEPDEQLTAAEPPQSDLRPAGDLDEEPEPAVTTLAELADKAEEEEEEEEEDSEAWLY